MATLEETAIAQWMLSEYLKANRLTQSHAARSIRQQFGEAHVYIGGSAGLEILPAFD